MFNQIRRTTMKGLERKSEHYSYEPTKADIAQAAWRQVGASGQPAYGSGFSGDSSREAQFMKDTMGFVRFQGRLQATGIATPNGSTIFTLPAGYRPSMPIQFACSFNQQSSGSFSASPETITIQIETAGHVRTFSNDASWPYAVNYIDLSTITFKAV
jgi:hypothetical protein